jgi:hypothetical protein
MFQTGRQRSHDLGKQTSKQDVHLWNHCGTRYSSTEDVGIDRIRQHMSMLTELGAAQELKGQVNPTSLTRTADEASTQTTAEHDQICASKARRAVEGEEDKRRIPAGVRARISPTPGLARQAQDAPKMSSTRHAPVEA